MDQLVECLQQAGLQLRRRFGPSAGRTEPLRRLDALEHLALRLDHCVPAHSRRLGHGGLAAPAQRLGH